MFRRELLEKININSNFSMGDTPLWLDLSQLTKFKYFNEVFAVYRLLENSVSRSRDKKKHYYFILCGTEMRIFYCHKYNYAINNKLLKFRTCL